MARLWIMLNSVTPTPKVNRVKEVAIKSLIIKNDKILKSCLFYNYGSVVDNSKEPVRQNYKYQDYLEIRIFGMFTVTNKHLCGLPKNVVTKTFSY